MDSITSGLNINQGGIISFVGAGGKTTLMLRMAEELACADSRILVTTTTKIWPPEKKKARCLIVTDSKQELLGRVGEAFNQANFIVAASHHCPKTNKLIGFDPEFLDDLWKSGCFRWILAEADGSAGKPIKAPGPHEPVIPRETSYILGLIGLSALGKPLTEKHVHRVDLLKKITGMTGDDKIDVTAIAALISHENGLFKNCPDNAKTIAFLNQADVLPSLEAGILIADQLCQSLSERPDLVVIGQAATSPAIVKTCSRISIKE